MGVLMGVFCGRTEQKQDYGINTPAAKHLWGYRDSKNCMCGAATCDLNHIMTSCTHFGERPSLDDIAEMKDVYGRWL